MECNNRKILSKLYQEIKDFGNENFFTEKEGINSQILSLFDKLMLNVPYNITTVLDFDWIDLCKLYNVQLEKTGNSLLEQLMDYLKAMNQLCGCKVFVLLNFRMYLNSQELKNLYEFIAYQQIYVLLIEYLSPASIAHEKGCIIDADGCIIEIEGDNLQHIPSVKFGENTNKFEV